MRPIEKHASIRIEPGILVDHPLSKERIAVYNSGLVPLERYERDAGFIAATAPESLRIDLGWGAEWMPWSREVVGEAEDGSIRYDFEETDRIARVISRSGARPYWSYCYVPKAVRSPEGDWREMGSDDSVWVRAVADYVAGLEQRGAAVGYHEIYNEPDLRDERTGEAVFYSGQLEDYLDLYRATSKAIREVAPNARIGGPALAVPGDHRAWLDAFLETVAKEDLPLDFLSFHHYGHFGIDGALRNARESIAGFPQLQNVELHLNEYNAFPIDYPRGGVQDGHYLASTFAAEIHRLLGHRELTRTHWAQFLDSGHGNFSGMVDIDGKPKPIYAVYHFYQAMPVDRVFADVQGPRGLGCLAAADEHRAGAIIWNRHIADLSVQISIAGAEKELFLTLIDAEGIGQERRVKSQEGTVTVELSRGAVALLRSGEPFRQRNRRQAWGVQLVSNPDHAGWTDFDEETLTFRFGTGAETGWLAHGADLLEGAEALDWIVSARDAEGGAAEATVVVREEGADRTVAHRTLSGEGAPDWESLLSGLPGAAGGRRVIVAVRAPQQTFVRVAVQEKR